MKPFLTLVLFLGLAAAATPWAKKAAGRDFHWYYYPIDTTGKAAGYAKLRYDSHGVPKVAYAIGEDIFFAELTGNKWAAQWVDSAYKYEAKMAMDLDKDGNPHIVHENWRYEKVIYAGFDGKQWVRKDVDSIKLNSSAFYEVGIRVDSKMNRHIFYPRNNNDWNDVTYSLLDKDLKKVETSIVCDCGSSGKWGSMILDSKESPVLAFFRHQFENVQVSYRTGNAWSADTLKNPAYPGSQAFYSSIARDSADNFLVAHHNRTSMQLVVSSGKPGGPWKNEKVDTLTGSPQWSAQSPLAMTAGGRPYLAYIHTKQVGEFGAESSRLLIAYKPDSVWIKETVDSTGNTGLFADIAINGDDLPSIVYYNATKRHLLLAVARPQAPSDTNGNGIPDYRETPITTVGTIGGRKGPASRPAGKKRGAVRFDAHGRALPGSRAEGGQGGPAKRAAFAPVFSR